MHVVSVRGVTKIFEEGSNHIVALNGVDLDVDAGEMVLLMGPSGSGKTTLLSVMGCILRATSGSVELQGREVGNLPERELPKVRLDNIGFVFQGFNLFPTLSAGENIELALDLKGIRGAAAEARASDLLAKVGLEERYASFPANLSGGQKQRVAIARALAGEPALILADEPTAALDWRSGENVMEMMRAVAHTYGRAVVVVSHDSRVLPFADRVVQLEDGRLVENAAQEAPQRTGKKSAGGWNLQPSGAGD